MAKTTLSWIDEPTGAVNAIWVDAVLVENFSRSADVTEFAIEGGSKINDHVSPNQPTLTLEIFISDTPVVVPGGQLAAGVTKGPDIARLDLRPRLESSRIVRKVTQPGPIIGLPSKRLVRGNKELARGPIARNASVLQFTGKLERIANVFDLLNENLENGIPHQVSMRIGTFKDLVISALEAPRDANSGTGLSFTVDFKQITRVTTEASSGTRKKKTAKPRNQDEQNAGAKDTKEATPEQNSSIIATIFGTG